jgi:hypothetical protein
MIRLRQLAHSITMVVMLQYLAQVPQQPAGCTTPSTEMILLALALPCLLKAPLILPVLDPVSLLLNQLQTSQSLFLPQALQLLNL